MICGRRGAIQALRCAAVRGGRLVVEHLQLAAATGMIRHLGATNRTHANCQSYTLLASFNTISSTNA